MLQLAEDTGERPVEMFTIARPSWLANRLAGTEATMVADEESGLPRNWRIVAGRRDGLWYVTIAHGVRHGSEGFDNVLGPVSARYDLACESIERGQCPVCGKRLGPDGQCPARDYLCCADSDCGVYMKAPTKHDPRDYLYKCPKCRCIFGETTRKRAYDCLKLGTGYTGHGTNVAYFDIYYTDERYRTHGHYHVGTRTIAGWG